MKINQLKVGVILSYLSLILGSLVSIVYTPIMLRLLGQSEYGLYTTVNATISYLGLLNFGFGASYVRYYFKYKTKNDHENIARLNGMYLTVFTVLSLVCVAAGTILVLNTENIFGAKFTESELNTAKILMAILVVNMALSFPNTVFNSYITAKEQFLFQRIMSFITSVLNPFLILPVLLIIDRYNNTLGLSSGIFISGAIGLVGMSTAVNIFVYICNFVYCRKHKMRFIFKGFQKEVFKDIAVFSTYIFLNSVVDEINWMVDKFLLGIYHGTKITAIYGLASQIVSYFRSFSSAIYSVFIPRVNNIVQTSNDYKVLTGIFTRVGRVQFIVLSLISSGLVFFGRPFVYFWGGEDYLDAYPIMLMLIIPLMIPLIQNLGIEIQKAKNMHKFRSVVYAVIAVGNLLLSIPLCKYYEGLGAAFGTALSLIIGNGIIMNWYYHKKVGLNIGFFWKEILKFVPSMLIPIACGVLVNIFVDLYSPLTLCLCIGGYTAVFLVSAWFIGFNNYERDLIRKPVGKILGKLTKKSKG